MDDDEKGIQPLYDDKPGNASKRLIESKIHSLYENLRLCQKQIESLKQQRDHYKKCMDSYKDKYLKQQRIIQQMKNIIVCKNDGDVKMKSLEITLDQDNKDQFGLNSQPSKCSIECADSNTNSNFIDFFSQSYVLVMPIRIHKLNCPKSMNMNDHGDRIFALLLESDSDHFNVIEAANNVKIKISQKATIGMTFFRCSIIGKLPQIINAAQQIFDMTAKNFLSVFIVKKRDWNIAEELRCIQNQTKTKIVTNPCPISPDSIHAHIHGDRNNVNAAVIWIIGRFSVLKYGHDQRKDTNGHLQRINRIKKRKAQIDKFYASTQYLKYISAVPKHLMKPFHPQTPNYRENASRRVWRNKVNRWNAQLFDFKLQEYDCNDKTNYGSKYAFLCYKGNGNPKKLTESNAF